MRLPTTPNVGIEYVPQLVPAVPQLYDEPLKFPPSEVFIKGYIRSYANIIGSDVDEMLNSYEESIGNKLIEKDPNSESTNTVKKY